MALITLPPVPARRSRPVTTVVLAGVTGVAVAAYALALRVTDAAPGPVRAAVMAAVAFGLVAAIFVVLERLSPEIEVTSAARRRERRVDVGWWFLGYASRFAADMATLAGMVLTLRLLPVRPASGLDAQPVALQIIEALLIGDVIQYWLHRGLHRPLLWTIHAIHHSAEDLTWISATRIHPLETILKGPIEMIPLYFLGFSSVSTLPSVAIVLGLYEILLHANVDWRFGPLGYVIASPAFHRWHHTSEVAGFDKNFAGVFPVLDLVFGTYHLPDRASRGYGLGLGQHLAPSLWRQIAHPFHSAIRVDATEARRAA